MATATPPMDPAHMSSAPYLVSSSAAINWVAPTLDLLCCLHRGCHCLFCQAYTACKAPPRPLAVPTSAPPSPTSQHTHLWLWLPPAPVRGAAGCYPAVCPSQCQEHPSNELCGRLSVQPHDAQLLNNFPGSYVDKLKSPSSGLRASRGGMQPT